MEGDLSVGKIEVEKREHRVRQWQSEIVANMKCFNLRLRGNPTPAYE